MAPPPAIPMRSATSQIPRLTGQSTAAYLRAGSSVEDRRGWPSPDVGRRADRTAALGGRVRILPLSGVPALAPGYWRGMEIPKEQILELLRQQCKQDQAGQADQELPDQVDTDQHAGLLEKFGLSPADLIGKLGGGGIPGL